MIEEANLQLFSHNINISSNTGKMTERKYDLVVLGATGYTGQYVAEEVSQTIILWIFRKIYCHF